MFRRIWMTWLALLEAVEGYPINVLLALNPDRNVNTIKAMLS